jgi:hypothetical protein
MKQHQNVRRHRFLGLLRRHPAASVFTLWVTLLLLGGLSTATLVHTDVEAKMPASSGEPSPEEPSPSQIVLTQHSADLIQQESNPAVPLLSFGAIALSCALGCLLLSKTARPTSYPVRYKEPEPTALPQPSIAEFNNPDDSEPSKPVTVVPKQQNHPLDWDEPSLADSLDLRQRRPLSHWL